MAEFRFRPPKTSEEEDKCVASAMSSLLNVGVDSKLVCLSLVLSTELMMRIGHGKEI